MKAKYWPFVYVLLFIACLMGLFQYAASDINTHGLPRWAQPIPGIAFAVLGGLGSISAKRATRFPLFLAYSVFTLASVCGTLSFCVFTDPATINIAGLLLILLGICGAFSVGLVIAFSRQKD